MLRLLFDVRDILNEYTRRELRDVYSLPLDISKLEMRLLFDRIVEMHWSYRASYFFLSANCAHETMGLLQAALLNRGQLTAEYVVRPDSLYQLLLDLKIGKGYELDLNLRHSIYPYGQFYPSQTNLIEDVSKTLKSSKILDQDIETDDILSSSLANRQDWLTRILQIRNSKEKVRNLSAFSAIQDLIAESMEFRILSNYFPKYLEERMKTKTQLSRVYNSTEQVIKDLLNPTAASGFTQDYGIPQQDPTQSPNVKKIIASRERVRPQMQKVHTEFFKDINIPGGKLLQAEKDLKKRAQDLLNKGLKQK